MANREWIYESPSFNSKGVTLTEARIEWWETGSSFAGGGWSEQSFEHFLANGPGVEGVPADVVAQLTDAVRETMAASP